MLCAAARCHCRRHALHPENDRMSLALVHSRARAGVHTPAVRVEVHLSGGLPATQIVGLPETAVRESRERVRAALLCAQFDQSPPSAAPRRSCSSSQSASASCLRSGRASCKMLDTVFQQQGG